MDKLESLINCDNKDESELNEILKEFGMVSDGGWLDENGKFIQQSIAIVLKSDIKSIVKGMKIIIPMLKKIPISQEQRDSDRPYKLNNKLLKLGNTISSLGDHYIIIHPDNDNLAKHINLGWIKVEKFNWIWRPINKVLKRSIKIIPKYEKPMGTVGKIMERIYIIAICIGLVIVCGIMAFYEEMSPLGSAVTFCIGMLLLYLFHRLKII